MSIGSDLRLIASASDKQSEALERLTFCTRAYLTRLSTGTATEKQAALAQLRVALAVAENAVG
jgi:hypothetical protein